MEERRVKESQAAPSWEAGKGMGRVSASPVLPAQFSQVSAFLEKELPSHWATSEMAAVLKSHGATQPRIIPPISARANSGRQEAPN